MPRSKSLQRLQQLCLARALRQPFSIRIPSRRSRLRHISVILDLHLPDMTGLELQTRLANKDGPPIIFLTGHGDIPTTVKAMKGGATEKSYTRLLRVLSRTHAVGHCDHHLMIAYGNYEILLGIPWFPNLNRPASTARSVLR